MERFYGIYTIRMNEKKKKEKKNEINVLHQNQSTHFGYDASLEIFEFDVWLFALLVATGSKYDL